MSNVRSASVGPLQESSDTSAVKLLFLLGGHAIFGLFLLSYSGLAQLHAFCTVALGIFIACTTKREVQVWIILFYIMGSEVLWRMTEPLFWELGKYATIWIGMIAILRFRRSPRMHLPSIYFLLLIPSAVLTFWHFDLWVAREQLASHLSGPLALAICTELFADVNISRIDSNRLFLASLGLILSVASIAISSTITAGSAAFSTNESSLAASGGFGPNQVSATLGIGILFALLLFLQTKGARLTARLIFLACLFIYTIQSVLTFSRTGLYLGVLSSTAFMAYSGKTRQRRGPLFALAVVLCIAIYLLTPVLDEFTQGRLIDRFSDTDVTGRDVKVVEDLDIWLSHFFVGVGPGLTSTYSASGKMPHTEFSRLLAEHGLLGLMALFILFALARRNFGKASTTEGKGISLALLTWSFGFMLSTGMRLVAPAVLFGFSGVRVGRESQAPESNNHFSL